MPVPMQAAPSALQVADSLAAGARRLPLVFPGLTAETQTKLVFTLILALVLVLLRRAVLRIVDRRVEDPSLRYRWSKSSAYAAFVFGLLVIVQVWFTAIRSVGTFLGLLSAGLAIALKDLVADLAGWVFILWRRPFDLGDRIQLGDHAGDVVDIRIFAFTILEIGNWVEADQSTGRMIHMPNASVFTLPLSNYTAGFPYLWNELPVLVTFESDWRKAKALLEGIVREETESVSQEAERALKQTTKRFLIHYRKLTPAVYTSVKDSGVMLTIRYLCRPRERRGTAQTLWERILVAFAGHTDIDFAYPTHRTFLNPLEGKEHARAQLPPLSSGGDAP
jgi:small-conductance mechanosensitive channel